MSDHPIDLRVSRSLELLDDLVRTAAEFAEREEQTARFFQNKRHGVNRRSSNELAELELGLAKETENAEGRFAQVEEEIRARHGRRSSRIHDAQSSGLRRVMILGTRAKERWLGDLQMRHFQVKKALPAKIKTADTELTEFGAKLAEQVTILTALRTRAQRAFTGYVSFVRTLQRPPAEAAETTAPSGADRDRLFGELESKLKDAESQLAAFQRLLLPAIFRFLPPVLLAVCAVIGAGALAFQLGLDAAAFRQAGITAAAALIGIFLLHWIGFTQGRNRARAIAATLVEAAQIHDAAALAAQTKNQDDRQRAQDEYDRVSAEIHEQWKRADDIESDFSSEARVKINSQAPRLLARNEKWLKARLAEINSERAAAIGAIRSRVEQKKGELTAAHEAEMAQVVDDESAVWSALETEWMDRMNALYEPLREMNESARLQPWNRALLEAWSPPAEFATAARFGHLDMDLAGSGHSVPRKLALPGPSLISIPLCLAFPNEGSLLFEVRADGSAASPGLNNVILRLLTRMPPGKISFTILDPVGLGQNFAGLMHLGDYEESLISRRIWTQREQIDERLNELSEHIEKVIQMYLRNEYATISEYNAQAGSVAEKYHFLVISDFPAGFTESSAQRLQSIVASGPRCGVFTLIHWDERQPLPDGFSAEDLRANSICLRGADSRWRLSREQESSGAALVLDPPPDAELELALVHKIGKASVDSNRVELPFENIAPKPGELWASSTTDELRVAIGRTGATKLQYLAIGKGTRQHALFAGKTGSGKSTLFHVIITNLALACSPDEVEFYLIDFKKGVEFKCYAEHQLPHARVVAIESDREFGLSVLQRVDDELKRRGDLFRRLGVQDIPGYKRAGGAEPMPRSLLIIDEFQEFFTEDDEVAQTASVLFDRIVRQGRAFGIHVLLGSQTLGGAYTLARATLGQMVIRVALQCNEADAYLIMDENNSAPRLLSRPGEGIYNDAAGALEGNSPFQVVWLSDDERDQWLDRVNELALARHVHKAAPIVFEGNAPADVRENALLDNVLATRATAAPLSPRIWLGAPNSIKGPTEVAFHRQSGNHLFVIGQREESALTMIGLSLLALAAQHPAGTAKFYLFHAAVPGSQDAAFIEKVVAAVPHGVTLATSANLAEVMDEISTELKSRASGDAGSGAPAVFVLIHGLQRFKKLRHEDDFDFGGGDSGPSPGAQLGNLIVEGSSLGVHLIATIDTYNNVGRFLSRKAMSEIEFRVLFQMSANDSASLIDSPKASGLGLHRALLYNEQQGSLETFRPYAMPSAEWLDAAAAKLRGGER